MANVGNRAGAATGDRQGAGPKNAGPKNACPKNYGPTDGHLKERICECLTEDPRIDASDIDVEVSERIVVLSGTVEDWWAKLAVEDLVEHCGGVQDVQNRLRIQPKYLD